MPSTASTRRRLSFARTARIAAILSSAFLSGCQSAGGGVFERLFPGRAVNYDRVPKPREGMERDLMARWLTPSRTPHTSRSKASGADLVLKSEGWTSIQVEPDPKADSELEEAELDYQQGRFDVAEPKFARIAKKKVGSPWGEKARFLLAESHFQRGRYLRAYDAYEKLISEYPATKYLDKLVSREFAIAQAWLAANDPQAPEEQKQPWYAAFDGARPAFDLNGHALKVLEQVRMHDPTGPLADDAALRIADHHAAAGDPETASVYYDQLSADHPKSPFLQRAQLASIDSKLKSYLGPDYDGSGLDAAREMIKQTMATFPERQTSNEKLYDTLDIINDQEAERNYRFGMYYKKTGKVASAEYYLGMVAAKWPRSKWGAESKIHLATLAKMPRKENLPSKIMTRPGSTDPFTGGLDTAGAAPGVGPNGVPGL